MVNINPPPQLQRVSNKNSLFTSFARASLCVESFIGVRNEIKVAIFTVSGRVGAMGLGEALENRVGPLVEGGELKRLEGADGQTGERKQEEERDGKREGGELVDDGEQSQVYGEAWAAGTT